MTPFLFFLAGFVTGWFLCWLRDRMLMRQLNRLIDAVTYGEWRE